MPNLAQFHPQVVHFAVALLLTGVLFRLVSLTGRLAFTKHSATVLLLFGTAAAVVSVESGDDAHGPVERIPGARTAVQTHEEHGTNARNIFLGVVAIEVLALGFAAVASTRRYTRWTLAASALVGLYGSFILYEAAEHGGELVYEYGGGPGLRTGNPADNERLLLAGLFNQSVADRKAGRKEDAARLIDEMSRRFGNDTTVRLLHVESQLVDRGDGAAARASLDAIAIDPANARLMTRRATLLADILVVTGQADSAKAVLDAAIARYPTNARLKAKRDSIR
ncbi:MAG: DUF2231 domain-containing protein [Gemmatimonas sp.]